MSTALPSNELPSNGSARTHHVARKRLRKRLEEMSLPPEEVARRVEALRARQGRAAVQQGVRAAKPKRKQSEGLRRRRALARRDGEFCHWCGAALDVTIRGSKVPSPPRATLDHVVPRSAGGAGSLDNLVLACEPCNAARGGIHSPGAFPRLVGLPSAKGLRSDAFSGGDT